MKTIIDPFEHIHIPEFDSFIRHPRNQACITIESTRLMVEILGWLESASVEFWESDFSSKEILVWEYALIIRYKREKDGKVRPACIIGFDIDNTWLHIHHIQWSSDKSVAFRFHSSFDTSAFLLKVMEESFLKRWIPVTMEPFPDGLENASYGSRAIERYERFRTGIEWLRSKYII